MYQNVPLRVQGDIRTLRLYPSEDRNAPLQGSLSVVNLNKDPVFAALSYTWGPPIGGLILEDGEITVDGGTVTITGNSSDALRRLRLPQRFRNLWVDALCINQADHIERSSQVAIMARIYSTATVVFAWLGEESFQVNKNSLLESELDAQETYVPRHGGNAFEDTGKLVVERTRYFKRRWIIQELFFAQTILLMCGSKIKEWDYLTKETMLRDEQFEILRELRLDKTRRTSGSEATSIRRKMSSSLVVELQDFDCEDPRDRLLAIANLNQEFLISPDYSLSTEEAYSRFTRMLLHQSPKEELLAIIRIAAYRASRAPSSLSLPSWVPNWESTLSEPEPQTYGDFGFAMEFQGITEANGLCLKLCCFEVLADCMIAVGPQPYQDPSAIETVQEGDLVCLVGAVQHSCDPAAEAVVLRRLQNLTGQYKIAGMVEINRGGGFDNLLSVLAYTGRSTCIS